MRATILRYLLKQNKPVSLDNINNYILDKVKESIEDLKGTGNCKETRGLFTGISSKKLPPTKHEQIVIQAVANGKKPAAILFKRCLDLVKKHQIPFQESPFFEEYIIAKDKKVIQSIISNTEKKIKLHQKLGLLLGYPKTAVKIYGTSEAMYDCNKMPSKYQGFFAFSKENYKEEMKVIDEWLE